MGTLSQALLKVQRIGFYPTSAWQLSELNRYAELLRNQQKLRIKSLNGNNLNNVGTAYKEFIDVRNKLNNKFNTVGQFDRINRSIRFTKGVDAMTVNKFKDLSKRSTLPTIENPIATQQGNSQLLVTRKSGFLFCKITLFKQYHHVQSMEEYLLPSKYRR